MKRMILLGMFIWLHKRQRYAVSSQARIFKILPPHKNHTTWIKYSAIKFWIRTNVELNKDLQFLLIH